MRYFFSNKVRFINTLASSTIALSASFLLLACLACADEKTADLLQLPKAVADAVGAWFPHAQLVSATKETDKDQVVYDIELKNDGCKYEMDIQADGTTLEIEKEIAAKSLPTAVSTAVQTKHPNSTIKEVMEVNKVTKGKETLDHYEVVIETADKKNLELTASLDGKNITEE